MFFVYCAAAYLLGSLSPSIIQGRLKGIDIRKQGSGNPGTTNMLRVMGLQSALITLTLDVLKGVAAVSLGRLHSPLCAYICAVAVFAGHLWPCFYGFKGGKGVATAFGAILAVSPVIALSCLALTLAVIALSRFVSAGSLCGALMSPILAVWLKPDFLIEALIITALIFIKHKENIKRLLAGEESAISFKREKHDE
ncbi:MAG TPA: glycerol-3-phosphate 1-O-acyltransferase PlsY [Bacillota bacterium]|nr:glycerol-3-phosphate 1-O-acyltransferase PlsY [Bacillota bacterium]HQC35702.1 glycerol-3-phosphate 1-O-acyltransferase PlsY [Bacillota bacterium]